MTVIELAVADPLADPSIPAFSDEHDATNPTIALDPALPGVNDTVANPSPAVAPMLVGAPGATPGGAAGGTSTAPIVQFPTLAMSR